jgi:hypothetical protein
MNIVDFCPMHQSLKVTRTRWSIQQGFNSIQCNIQMGDTKNSIVMIPFNYYSEDDTCLLNFVANLELALNESYLIKSIIHYSSYSLNVVILPKKLFQFLNPWNHSI